MYFHRDCNFSVYAETWVKVFRNPQKIVASRNEPLSQGFASFDSYLHKTPHKKWIRQVLIRTA